MSTRICDDCAGTGSNNGARCAACAAFGRLPDTNPKTAFGVQKTPMHLIPPPALLAEAEVFGLGARKYGPYNWREHHVSASVYVAAALRHLMAWQERQDTDPESGQSHLAHVRACMGILIDAGHHGRLNDDRP